jgi:hypothetical protein
VPLSASDAECPAALSEDVGRDAVQNKEITMNQTDAATTARLWQVSADLVGLPGATRLQRIC